MSTLAQSTGTKTGRQAKPQKSTKRRHKLLEAKREWQLGGDNINPEQKRGKLVQNDGKDEVEVTKEEYERRKKGRFLFILFLIYLARTIYLLFVDLKVDSTLF